MEMLMTYGWAMLMVLVIISALTYFGVFNPQNLLPSKCIMPAGWSCRDFVVVGGATGSVKIKLLNGMGSNLKITSFNATLDNGDVSCQSSAIVFNMSNADMVDINTSSCQIPYNMMSGGKYRWKLLLRYYPENSDQSFTKTIAGELFTTVER
jgi:hypothetical protein